MRHVETSHVQSSYMEWIASGDVRTRRDMLSRKTRLEGAPTQPLQYHHGHCRVIPMLLAIIDTWIKKLNHSQHQREAIHGLSE